MLRDSLRTQTTNKELNELTPLGHLSTGPAWGAEGPRDTEGWGLDRTLGEAGIQLSSVPRWR